MAAHEPRNLSIVDRKKEAHMSKQVKTVKAPFYVFVSNANPMCWRAGPANDNGDIAQAKMPEPEFNGYLDDPSLAGYGYRGQEYGYGYRCPVPPVIIRAGRRLADEKARNATFDPFRRGS